MKTSTITRTFIALIAALFAYATASANGTSFDTFLKIEGVNGVVKTVKITGENFEYKFTDLMVSSYTISLVDATGRPVVADGTIECKSFVLPHVLEASGRISATTTPEATSTVQTAREAGSGMATGRRQYQPLVIRKRIDKSSPLLMKIAIDEPGVQLSVKVSAASYDLAVQKKM